MASDPSKYHIFSPLMKKTINYLNAQGHHTFFNMKEKIYTAEIRLQGNKAWAAIETAEHPEHAFWYAYLTFGMNTKQWMPGEKK